MDIKATLLRLLKYAEQANDENARRLINFILSCGQGGPGKELGIPSLLEEIDEAYNG